MRKNHRFSLSHLAAAFTACATLGLASQAMGQTQPANSLSIVTYGASTASSDNKTAIQNCINDAQSQGKSVWIPAGTWKIQSSFSATGITISGAGMTSAIIYRQKPNASTDTQIYLTRCTVRDIGIDGNGTARNNGTADTGFNLDGVGWLVERVKFQHTDAGTWASGSNGTIQNCQVATAYADGFNINNGDGPNKLGANLTVQNSSVNGSGDDGIAINSQGISLGRTNMASPKVLNNTQTNSNGANGIRIAGGSNSVVQGNLVSNQTTGENGIQVGKFGADGFQLTGGQVVNNTFTNVGGQNDCAGIWVYEDAQCNLSGNYILNSRQHGIRIGSSNITLGDNNIIDHPAKRGVWIVSGSTGSATIKNNTVKNLVSGQPAYQNDVASGFTTTLTGNSWTGGTGATGVTFFADFSYGGASSQPLPVGTYTLTQLAARGVANDWASSARVPSGRTLIMYSDDNFAGTSWTRTADTPNFSTLSPNANDMVSSVKVQ
jgi:parallel beta-helix repeat protein